MTPAWLVMVVVAQLLGWLSLPPKSLAEAAEREAIRRRIVGISIGSFTNENLNLEREARAASSISTTVETPSTDNTADGRDETWWRQRVDGLRASIATDERQIERLTAEIARLDSEAIARDDPAQQAVLRQHAIETRLEVEKARTNLAATRADLAGVIEEARRRDVPPGWLR